MTCKLGGDWVDSFRSRYRFLAVGSSLVFGWTFGVALFSAAVSIITRGATPADFCTFFSIGRAVNAGRSPYSMYPLAEVPGWILLPNTNPPFALPLFSFLASFTFAQARELWYWASLIVYGVTIGVLLFTYRYRLSPLRAMWPLAVAGLWYDLHQGHLYGWLALVTALAWIVLDRKQEVAAGAVIGFLVAYKPNLAVWPVLLFLAGRRRLALACGASFAVVTLASIVAFGPQVYQQWLRVLSDVTETQPNSLVNNSLIGFTARFGWPESGYVLSGLGLASLAFWAYRWRPDPMRISGAAIAMSLLAAPVAWTGYVVLLMPLFVFRPWSWPLAIAAVAITLPNGVAVQLSEQSVFLRLLFSSWYGLAMALVIVSCVAGFRPVGPVGTSADLRVEGGRRGRADCVRVGAHRRTPPLFPLFPHSRVVILART